MECVDGKRLCVEVEVVNVVLFVAAGLRKTVSSAALVACFLRSNGGEWLVSMTLIPAVPLLPPPGEWNIENNCNKYI